MAMTGRNSGCGSVGCIRLLGALICCIEATAAPDRAPPPGAADFTERIRPFVKTYCLGCHSTKAHKGGLDLERFATLEEVRADIESWQAMAEMLEDGEMPPEGKPRPTAEERRLVIAWIGRLLEREAQLRAGDPGPIQVRRLNNAEYRYTIRDLTGVDLRPSRHFPADGAAGEGFLNASGALSISPDLLSKYLDAARETAAHAVLLPDGFRFSTSKYKEDWTNEVLTELRGIYARYSTDLGEIPLDRYLRATVVHRGALGSSEDAFTRVATEEKLSPKYLRVLWQALTSADPSALFDGIRTKWRQATPEDVPVLLADIRALQGLIWRKREPQGAHALDDRYVPAPLTLSGGRAYRLEAPEAGAEVVFYLATQTIAGEPTEALVILEQPRFESSGKPTLSLRDAVQAASRAEPDKTPTTSEGVHPIDPSRFGRHPRDETFDRASLLVDGSEVLEVRLPQALVWGRSFVVDARLDPQSSPETVVRLHVGRTPKLPQVERGLEWQYREAPADRSLLIVHGDETVRERITSSAEELRRILPARVCYPGVIVVDTVVTLERFHRGDTFLSRLLVSEREHERLERLWEELHFISGDALQVWNSLSTLTRGEMTAYRHVRDEVERRARETERMRLAAEPGHLDALIDLAARAYRRPLAAEEEQSLRDLYQSLRQSDLPHDEAFRAVLTRVLVSPSFLCRIEHPAPGQEPGPVSDWELATRLSYFLWSSIPDDELRRAAAAGRLRDPEVLTHETRRMLRDPRIRALAIEFGTQWLEVRGFDRFQGKNQELFPTFDAELCRSMYEESIRFFQDMFQADRPLRELLDSDHAVLDERLARHYGIPGVEGEEFRRVEGVKERGRGGIFGLGSVLAKHSAASRTSPVLRGNFIAEVLLGERLPRPPDGVPKLPDAETEDGLTVRQLVENHAQREECAVCHQRIDPLGFALEQYDTIGRLRETDVGGRPVDARARLDGAEFEGIDGLRQHLLTRRKPDFVGQFCRKLLGYALGRRVLLSDRQLLDEMAAQLEETGGRLSAVILAVVRSRQFQFIRGAEPAKGTRS